MTCLNTNIYSTSLSGPSHSESIPHSHSPPSFEIIPSLLFPASRISAGMTTLQEASAPPPPPQSYRAAFFYGEPPPLPRSFPTGSANKHPLHPGTLVNNSSSPNLPFHCPFNLSLPRSNRPRSSPQHRWRPRSSTASSSPTPTTPPPKHAPWPSAPLSCPATPATASWGAITPLSSLILLHRRPACGGRMSLV